MKIMQKLEIKNYITTYLFLFITFSGFSQIHYIVNAFNGLIVRDQPNKNSARVGKLNYKDSISTLYISKADTIVDNGYSIAGHWVKIENGYIFDGFLGEIRTNKEREKFAIYGNVKSISRYTQNYSHNGKEEVFKGNISNAEKYFFDEDFNCLEQYKSIDGHTKKATKLYFKYTYAHGKLIKKQSFSLKDGKEFSIEKYNYNKQGLLSEMYLYKTNDIKYKKDEPYKKRSYQYDVRNHLIADNIKYFHNDLNQTDIYTYDNNNKISHSFINSKKDTIRLNRYFYDKENRCIKRTYKNNTRQKNSVVLEEFKYKDSLNYSRKIHLENDSKGNIKQKTMYKYDSFGNVIEEFIFGKANTHDPYRNMSEPFYIARTKYNYAKNSIKYTVANSDDIEIYTEMYDYKGNLLKKIIYDNSTDDVYYTYSYKYVFDQRNNWIKKTEYSNDIILKETFREIKYF